MDYSFNHILVPEDIEYEYTSLPPGSCGGKSDNYFWKKAIFNYPICFYGCEDVYDFIGHGFPIRVFKENGIIKFYKIHSDCSTGTKICEFQPRSLYPCEK